MNPLLLKIKVVGLEVLDQEKKLMVGFESFLLDISFLKLFQKTYHVEALDLTGLKIHATLLANGRINLMDLVLQKNISEDASVGSTDASDVSEKEGALKGGSGIVLKTDEGDPKALPVLEVPQISVIDAEILFEDQSVEPNFSIFLSDVMLNITGFSTILENETKISFQTKLGENGTMGIGALLNPMAQPLVMETSFYLNGYALSALGSYVGKYTGRDLDDGWLDLKMNYRIADNKLKATHKLLIQNFEFGKKVDSPDALSLPFGLAIALLEDAQGKMDISLPVSGDMDDPKFKYAHLIGQVARNFLLKIVTKPFSVFGSLLGESDEGVDELGYVRFVPGKPDVSDEERHKIKTLVIGLKDRPRLQLELNGCFDFELDWKAIQEATFAQMYAEARKESNGSESEVYQLLYQRHFGIRSLWALAKKYKEKVGAYAHDPLVEEIKRQLIEAAPPDQAALRSLAEARAQAVYDIFIAEGFDANRLSMGKAHSTVSSMGYVPMEFTLTVFSEKNTSITRDGP